MVRVQTENLFPKLTKFYKHAYTTLTGCSGAPTAQHFLVYTKLCATMVEDFIERLVAATVNFVKT